jgi:hypothetical protein
MEWLVLGLLPANTVANVPNVVMVVDLLVVAAADRVGLVAIATDQIVRVVPNAPNVLVNNCALMADKTF